MAVPYVGQIIMTGLDFVPRDFAACDGQLLSVHTYRELYAVLGTRYGGDGVNNFALPDLRGATPVGAGASADPSWAPAAYALNQSGGAETVVLKLNQMPAHTHGKQAAATNTANSRNPDNARMAVSNVTPVTNTYGVADGSSAVRLADNTVAPAGADTGHQNMQPFRVVNFCIALHGITPSRA
jgi:microcystin-dependent protein